jgi:dTMP kinase
VRGRFISLDGIDGCGKTTQARLLADELGAVLTREPGGTALGREIRDLLLGDGHPRMSARAEALLYAADRAEHVAEVVAPALAAGRHVVSDRSWASSLAYQGHGRELDVAAVDQVNHWAVDDVLPDLVIVIDIGSSEARRRVGDSPDRIEGQDDDFHRRVADGFAALVRSDPERFVAVDGTGARDEVYARIRAVVKDRLSL